MSKSMEMNRSMTPMSAESTNNKETSKSLERYNKLSNDLGVVAVRATEISKRATEISEMSKRKRNQNAEYYSDLQKHYDDLGPADQADYDSYVDSLIELAKRNKEVKPHKPRQSGLSQAIEYVMTVSGVPGGKTELSQLPSDQRADIQGKALALESERKRKGEQAEDFYNALYNGSLPKGNQSDAYGRETAVSVPQIQAAPESSPVGNKDFGQDMVLYDRDFAAKQTANTESSEPVDKVSTPKAANDTMLDYPGFLLRGVTVDRSKYIEEASFKAAQEKLMDAIHITDADRDSNGRVKLWRRLGKIKNSIWMGGVARGYYETKFRRQAAEKMRNDDIAAQIGAKSWLDLDQIKDPLDRARAVTMRRMILDASMDSVRTERGESREQLEADNPARVAMLDLIKRFAVKDKDGKYMTPDEFAEQKKRIYAQYADELFDNKGDKTAYIDNYYAIAEMARATADHAEGLAAIEKGFQMYRAETRNDLNTEAHRTRVEAAVEKWEHSKFGKFIPPEIVAAAAGVAGYVGSSVLRSTAGQIISFGGGSIATGVIGAVREGNAVKSERATLAQQLASGNLNTENKINQQIGETIYQMASAQDMMNKAKAAIDSGDTKAMFDALTEMTWRQKMGDQFKVDLISYSSPDEIATESLDLITSRAELIVALRKANPDFDIDSFNAGITDKLGDIKSLNDKNLLKSADLPDQAKEMIGDIQAKDKLFAKLKAKRQGIRGVGTCISSLVIGSAVRAVGNYVIDQITPDTVEVTHVEPGDNAHYDKLTTEQIANLKSRGATVEAVDKIVNKTTTETVNADQAVADNPLFQRSAWLSNNTSISDGNELAGHIQDGKMFYQPTGASFVNGIHIEQSSILNAAQQGNIHLKLSPTADTQSHPFDVVGKLVNGRVEFDVEPGSPAAKMIADRSYKFAEVADNNGFVYATDIGSGTANSFDIAKTIQEKVTEYNVQMPSKTVTHAVDAVTAKTEFHVQVPDKVADYIPLVPIPLWIRRNMHNAETPETPEKHETPEQPVKPETPEQPVKPEQPEQPENSNSEDSNPTEQISSIETNEPNKSDESAKTNEPKSTTQPKPTIVSDQTAVNGSPALAKLVEDTYKRSHTGNLNIDEGANESANSNVGHPENKWQDTHTEYEWQDIDALKADVENQLNQQAWAAGEGWNANDKLGAAKELFDIPDTGSKTMNALGVQMLKTFVNDPTTVVKDLNHFVNWYKTNKISA